MQNRVGLVLVAGWALANVALFGGFWMWAAVPLLGFAVERALRDARHAPSTEIFAGHALRSGVTRLEIRRPPGFRHRAGDYLFLCVPEIARHEWHPFTISNAPERDRLTLHVRGLEDWTSARGTPSSSEPTSA